ncbi:MAG: hypothetical protein INH41_01505 [Myxococcaceae bacterium]|jgi:hypothetical protein|nr:hypothetical protein [Myxococcaceae bacterium]MCA3011055.1 hypothetical protein [Myxococcaceae bacterium]
MSRLSAAVFFVVLPACGLDTSVDVATESSSLLAAQCDAQASGGAVGGCFDAFRACRSQAGAVEADCRAALAACLPEGLPRSDRGHSDGGCRGAPGSDGRPEGGPAGDGMGPLTGERPERGGRGRRGHGGGRGPRGPVGLDDAAVQQCQAAARSCLDAGTDEASCRDAAHACIRDALGAAFTARCQELEAACAANEGQDCSAITSRCSAGLREPPPPGACAVPDAGAP